jgi:hypothetical protein
VVDASGNATDYVAEASYNMDINGDGNKTDNVGIDEVLCLWNHETMSDKEFATALNGITHYSKMVVQMEQCFSGGFVHDLAGPRRVIISAANWGQFSWGRQDPGTNNYSYDMFEYYFLAALRGSTPDGTATVNADTNGDGKVSILEAYQYARAHDTAAETPWYDDTGTGNEVNNPNQAPPPKRAARGTPVPPVEGNLGATYFLPL